MNFLRWAFDRLREPSTYAGAGVIVLSVGQAVPAVRDWTSLIAGVLAYVSMHLPEVPKPPAA